MIHVVTNPTAVKAKTKTVHVPWWRAVQAKGPVGGVVVGMMMVVVVVNVEVVVVNAEVVVVNAEVVVTVANAVGMGGVEAVRDVKTVGDQIVGDIRNVESSVRSADMVGEVMGDHGPEERILYRWVQLQLFIR